jgi:hypothetical protein
VFLGVEFKPVHDLIYLLDLASSSDRFSSDFYDMASKVDGFAVQIRYPDTIVEPSDDEVTLAISYAERFRSTVLKRIEPTGNS